MSKWMVRFIALAALAAPAMSSAALVGFAADRQHIAILNPPNTGRCAPAYLATVNIVPGIGVPTSTGTSNLGSFQATQSHCIATQPPTPIAEGLFSFAFANGDLLEGTYTGNVGPTGTPDFFTWTTSLVVTGGTGLFLNASGTLTDTGTFFRKANPAGPGFVQDYTGKVSGLLSLPAVPEPVSWMMMIAGFGLAGALLRGKRVRPMSVAA